MLREALNGTADDVEIYASIGDVLRCEERYAEAADAYTKAHRAHRPARKNAIGRSIYTRGIAYERSKRWQDAERDLKHGAEAQARAAAGA